MKTKPRVPAHNQKAFVVFCKFLQDNNALDDYFKYYSNDSVMPPCDYIMCGFSWGDAIDKGSIINWFNLHMKWWNICQTLDS